MIEMHKVHLQVSDSKQGKGQNGTQVILRGMLHLYIFLRKIKSAAHALHV